jgi:16S rRNA processing protein RimM
MRPGAELPGAVAAEALPPDAVEVGRVVGAWGVKGAIKVHPFSADPQALFSTQRWYLRPPELPRPAGARPATALPALLRVRQAKEQGDGVVAQIDEIDDRDAAQALAGARVFISRGSFPTPDADEFYWVDLIGLDVVNREGQALGRVTGLIETGPHCVLRLAVADDGHTLPAEGGERLIPFVGAYVDRVDLPGRTIHVDWSADF